MSNPPKDQSEGPPRKENFATTIVSMGLLVVLVFAFKSSVLDANNIPTGSMIPTLKIGDYLFVNKMRYSLRLPFTDLELMRIDDPKRGDIVTFIPPVLVPAKNYVKRVIGMPGDRLRIRTRGACELQAMLDRRKGGKTGRKKGTKARTGLIVSGTKKSAGREYDCAGSDGVQDVREPRVDFVEFQVNGKGPWRNTLRGVIDAKRTREMLVDADDVSVLHPDLRLAGADSDMLPVLFRETVNGTSHLIVETNRPLYRITYSTFCKNISRDEGCLIPAEHYFVMGDNRDDSKDSRYLGLIHRDKILGKAVLIYFSINWYDKICAEFISLPPAQRRIGFKLPDFPPREQKKYCHAADRGAGRESPRDYMVRTLRYRLPRMDVRWTRPFTLLE